CVSSGERKPYRLRMRSGKSGAKRRLGDADRREEGNRSVALGRRHTALDELGEQVVPMLHRDGAERLQQLASDGEITVIAPRFALLLLVFKSQGQFGGSTLDRLRGERGGAALHSGQNEATKIALHLNRNP